ncbi:MAG: hypothetical protein GQ569_01475 [Methylococcaceae bacterium]|nr:hypothetical protein [Methylococcaceae bacterium]
MFVENIDVVDFVLEAIKVALVIGLIFILWSSGKKYPELSGGSWNLILLGFISIAVGMLLDWSDEIINYKAIEVLDLAETIIEEGILMLGFVLVTIGFNKWFAFVGRFLGINRS